MSAVALLFFIAGAALLIFGFKKNNRALLTIAAFFWLASGTWSDAARGFSDGWNRSGPAVNASTAQ
jgi:hypothetical protein